MNKTILIATGLNVWSINKGVGAPSFYKTIELYHKKGFSIYLYTTEKYCVLPEFINLKTIELPKFNTYNIRYFYSISRAIIYLLNQISFLYFILKNKHYKSIDLFYGYEIEFIPILHILSKIFKIPYISRFQGTVLYPVINDFCWKLRYFPHYLSLKLNSDLTIMTDDGTKGIEVIDIIRKNHLNVFFIKNGVNFQKFDLNKVSEYIKTLGSDMCNYTHNFVSISRLQKWKRVDRSLDVYNLYSQSNPNSRYILVGDGIDRSYLEKYVYDNKIRNVEFTGGLNSDEVNYLLFYSNVFLSHYELSNMGNPLWEAINNNCLVVTINNGDTNKIIVDNYNGIISDEDNYLDNAKKLANISLNQFIEITENANLTLRENVCSWDERMELEYLKVSNILNK